MATQTNGRDETEVIAAAELLAAETQHSVDNGANDDRAARPEPACVTCSMVVDRDRRRWRGRSRLWNVAALP